MAQRQEHEISFSEKELMEDFSVSFWLKQQIIESKSRDPLDALRDADLLVQILEQRCIALKIITVQ